MPKLTKMHALGTYAVFRSDSHNTLAKLTERIIYSIIVKLPLELQNRFRRVRKPPVATMFDLVATEDDQRACAPLHRVRFVSESNSEAHRARYTGVEVPRPRARRALARACPRAPVHQAPGVRHGRAFSGGLFSHGRL